jgi:hypothetical protein
MRVGDAGRALCFVSIIAMGFLLGGMPKACSAEISAELPKRSVGDRWKYTVDYKRTESSPIGMIGTMTMEVTRDSVTVYQSGSYECYEYTIEASGTVYGEGITGTWTMSGKGYDVESDLSFAKTSITTDATFTYAEESSKITQEIETIYDPPLQANKGFPLSAGKSWSAIATKTTTTKTDIDGNFDQETDVTTDSENYIVLRTETTEVTAGEFQTFVIKVTKSDGSSTELYYSPNAEIEVKYLDYDEKGELAITSELLEYSVLAEAEPFPSVYVVAVAGLAVVAIGGVLGYVLFSRRNRTKSSSSMEVPKPPS